MVGVCIIEEIPNVTIIAIIIYTLVFTSEHEEYNLLADCCDTNFTSFA